MGYGTNFSSRRVLFAVSGVGQGKGPGPDYGTSSSGVRPWLNVPSRGVSVAVVFRFEVFETHAGFRKVDRYVVFEVREDFPMVFARCIGAVRVVWVGAVGPPASQLVLVVREIWPF